MTYNHYSPEWLAENCDPERAFEVAMRRHLLRLLDDNRELKEQLEAVGAGGVGPLIRPQVEQQDEPVASASAWFALVMNAAAEIEDASNCLQDADAKRVATSAAKHYRNAANALYTRPQPKQPLTDEQIAAAIHAWFSVGRKGDDFDARMRAAIEAAHGIGQEGGEA